MHLGRFMNLIGELRQSVKVDLAGRRENEADWLRKTGWRKSA